MEEAIQKINMDNVYICSYVATTGPSYEVYTKADRNPRLACLEGKHPIKYISKSIYLHGPQNIYLVQGEVIGKQLVYGEGEIEKYYYDDELMKLEEKIIHLEASNSRYEFYDIIYVTEWEIIAPIDKGDKWFSPKEYFNIFDFIG